MLSALAKHIERNWYRPTTWPNAWLWPLAALFALVAAVRRSLFKLAIKRCYLAPVPVWVVGNIAVGGTGKTPFVIALCQWLTQRGLKVAIVSRGYGSTVTQDAKHVEWVTQTSDAAAVGDEPLLLAKRCQVPVFIAKQRVLAVQAALKTQPDVIIADDGLQHYPLGRAVEIVLVDGQRGHGNGALMPVGPLREPLSRLQQVDLTVFSNHSEGYWLQPDQAYPVAALADERSSPRSALTLAELQQLPDITLVAGIGAPNRFFQQMAALGIQASCCLPFADHHAFTELDFHHIDGAILMTEKDAVKCASFAKPNWYYLAVDAQLAPPVLSRLEQLLQQRSPNHGIR